MTEGRAFEVATLGGGCFWCLEAVFEQLQGVEKVVSGYAGGHVDAPSYKQVCTGTTGHAEVVQIHFDPVVISFGDLLSVFFTIHDPTTPNRQGGDVGTQYRSVVLFHTPEQEATTRSVIGELEREEVWADPIVTEIVPLARFYAAEDYHQEYFRTNLDQPYCQIVVEPKVVKFRKQFQDRLRP